MTESILARIPEALAQQVAEGSAERVGMIIRDAATKKILGHLQETSAMQSIVGSVLETGSSVIGIGLPTPGVLANVLTVVQNEQIKSKLDTVQMVLGGVQKLQLFTLVTSVAGIGVTAASTAILLNRMSKIEKSMSALGEQISDGFRRNEDWDISKTLRAIEVQLDRLAEAEVARKTDTIFESAEHELHKSFGELQRATLHVLDREVVPFDLVACSIQALALSGAAQLRALTIGNELGRAEQRAEKQSERLFEIALRLPDDQFAELVGAESGERAVWANYFAETRMRMASLPGFLRDLRASEVDGREYIDNLESEESNPVMLVLPFNR